MKNPWQTRSSVIAYDNPWLQLQHNEVINPSGGEGIYGVVHFKNLAVGIIPIDEHGYTYLVGQFRYALEAYSWEIPEGGCPIGSDPLETAKRELSEETGLIASDWKLIQTTHLSNSVTDEIGFIYTAKDLQQGKSHPEETEELAVRYLPLAEAISMAMSGQITDSLSVMGLLRLACDPKWSIR